MSLRDQRHSGNFSNNAETPGAPKHTCTWRRMYQPRFLFCPVPSQHCWSFKCRLYSSISGIPSHDPDTGSWQSVPNARRREPDCGRKHCPQGQVARLRASALEAGCADPSARGGGRHVRGRSGRSGQPQQCGCCHREQPPTCFHGCLWIQNNLNLTALLDNEPHLLLLSCKSCHFMSNSHRRTISKTCN